jgi:hypothetical protein
MKSDMILYILLFDDNQCLFPALVLATMHADIKLIHASKLVRSQNHTFASFIYVWTLRLKLSMKILANIIAQVVSYCRWPTSIPGQVMWDLLWTKWHLGRLSLSTLVSQANFHSTNYTLLI